MSGLEERLHDAIREALNVASPDDRIAMRYAIVAAAKVLAEEFGPRPEDAAPPVRELPVRRCVAENPYTGNRCAQPEGHALVHQDANGDQWRDGDEPVRELPTEPGSVLLVTGTGNAEAERPMFFANDGWHYVDNDGDACTRPPGTVTWRAATVTPTAVLTQVRAELAAIADASRFDPKEPPENVLADLRERAAEAVNVLDGEVGK